MWCDLWGMKLHASKAETMIVSRSRTIHPQPTQWTLDGTALKETADLVILGIKFDAKVTFDWSAVWCSSADSHLKLLDKDVKSACLIAGDILDLAHRRSVALLCMLFEIKCNPMHPMSGALPLPHVPARDTRRHSFATPSFRTSQHRGSFVPLLLSPWNDINEWPCVWTILMISMTLWYYWHWQGLIRRPNAFVLV